MHCDVLTGTKLLFVLLWKMLYSMVDDTKASRVAIYIIHIHTPIKEPSTLFDAYALDIRLPVGQCPVNAVRGLLGAGFEAGFIYHV